MAHRKSRMSHQPVAYPVFFSVEEKDNTLYIWPKPQPLRTQFGDVVTWTILNNADARIQVRLYDLGEAIASFDSPQNSQTPLFGPGTSAALTGKVTLKPKRLVDYTYNVYVTYGGVEFNVDPDLQVEPPSFMGHGAVRLKRRAMHGKGGARKHAKRKGAKKK